MKTAPAPCQPPVIPADDAAAIRTEGLRKAYRRGPDGLVALEGLDLTVGADHAPPRRSAETGHR
ncbi:hypothetical protein [Streptomyces celluloflavus]|uniref:hypothetical protein n=1 Tax=Streptomyces celluloflavus TaxID=58344 RepID=UPI00369E437C